MSKEVKRIIAVVIFCEFLICLGMSLIFPVMPFIKNEYHFSAFDMGGNVVPLCLCPVYCFADCRPDLG